MNNCVCAQNKDHEYLRVYLFKYLCTTNLFFEIKKIIGLIGEEEFESCFT